MVLTIPILINYSSPQRNSNNNLDEGICSIDNICPYHSKWKLKAMVVQNQISKRGQIYVDLESYLT